MTVRRRRDDSERPAKKKNVLRQTSLIFFSKRHLFLIFVALQIKIIHVSTSYDRSHLLQPCGKLLSWASPIPLGNFYPLAPPHPLGISINHPWWGYGCFLESHIKNFNNSLIPLVITGSKHHHTCKLNNLFKLNLPFQRCIPELFRVIRSKI